MLTEDPRHLNVDRMQEATRRIEGVLEYAIHDKKVSSICLKNFGNMESFFNIFAHKLKSLIMNHAAVKRQPTYVMLSTMETLRTSF